MSLQADWLALLGAVLFALATWGLYRWTRSSPQPYWHISSTSTFSQPGAKSAWAIWTPRLFWVAWLLFLLAFLDVRWLVPLPQGADSRPQNQGPTEGIAIYLIIDQSGSMAEARGPQTKMALTRDVTRQFVDSRPNDLLGLVAFARAANVLSPLTLDHAKILEELALIDVAQSQDVDGTALGYAIFKTANLIAATKKFAQDLAGKGKPSYEINNAIMVLVTDGVQDPNPRDAGKQWRNIEILDAAKYAQEQDIKLYVINIDPQLALEEFAPHRRIMQRAADITGGHLYMVDSREGLAKVYRDIDTIEKKTLPGLGLEGESGKRPDLFERVSWYPWLIALGLLSLFAAILLETRLAKRTP